MYVVLVVGVLVIVPFLFSMVWRRENSSSLNLQYSFSVIVVASGHGYCCCYVVNVRHGWLECRAC